MASFTKRVETSNNHQKVTVKALKKANLELAEAKDAYYFLESQIKWHVDDDTATREKAVKDYIANF